MTRTEALAAIAETLGVPDGTPDEVAATATALVAAIADLRTRVYPALIDTALATHDVHLP